MVLDEIRNEINRVAETHFFLRPNLTQALQKQLLTDDAKKIVGNHSNYHEFWTATFSDKFFDMGTMIRLGSTIEVCLKRYYMHKKGYTKIPELVIDRNYNQGIFQRI